ncbi:hypothetical protein PHLGIDRAFT_35859 [Phlebiopsis gigantea 11061_1 CR5-6]|uniref:Uncharacterized protein n=1 Tax=Phlebiopsis gigantea (strain 11061_1 CR5-6) TaxID=745531 RepID=A0A0C3RXH9_PHLG1|nr:hypothetical protein PHLGIDRAFT_35859 [Phlebiopsis gigantea 11061_1 CR5-6]
MSLLLRAVARPRQTLLASLPRRHASSAHDEHHDHHHEEHTVYPKEDFFNKVWLGWTFAGLAAVGWYKYAPEAGEGTYLTDWMSYYNTSSEVWNKINLQHLVMSTEGQMEVLTIADAKKPPVHRYRFPQSFEQHSAHLQPVGRTVDLSGLVVKTDRL